MTDVFPNFKTNKGECQGNRDQCQKCDDENVQFGKLLKPNSDGKSRVKDCGDQTGRNKNNRIGGVRQQLKNNRNSPAASSGSSLHPGNEETMRGLIAVEDKHGKQVEPVHTAFEKQQKQHFDSRKPADNRPFLARTSTDKSPYTLCTYRMDEEREFIYRMALSYGMIDGGV